MKNPKLTILPLAALAAAAAPANAVTILASWDTWGDDSATNSSFDADSFSLVTTTPRIIESGNTLRDLRVERGSTDGTFGTLAGATAPADGALRLQKAPTDPTASTRDLWVEIVNDSGAALAFSGLHFDVSLANDNYNAYSVVFENVTQGSTSAVLGSGTFDSRGQVGDYDDIDIDAIGITLGASETGYFNITFSGATGRNSSSHIDNFAVTVVPEPSTAALLGLGGLALLRRRRK
jgi:hypothetical protein